MLRISAQRTILELEVTSLKESNEKLESVVDNQSKQILVLDGSNTALEEKYSEVKKQLKDVTSEASNLQAQHDSGIANLNKLHATQLREATTCFDKEAERLQRKLETTQREVETLHKKVCVFSY